MLGADGPRQYLIAMMNPSEQRFSGGATLTMSALRFSQGRVSFGKSYTVDGDRSRGSLSCDWPRVQRKRAPRGRPPPHRGNVLALVAGLG